MVRIHRTNIAIHENWPIDTEKPPFTSGLYYCNRYDRLSSQYFGILGSIFSAQAVIPPVKL
jgi:hypothetical protein